MDKHNAIEELDRAVSVLAEESVEKVDFDRIIELMQRGRDALKEESDVQKELSVIKAEYRKRIIGMLKANLACRENVEDRELAVRLTDDNCEIGAGEFIRQYQKVAVRFRMNFPATFGNLSITGKDNAGHSDWRDYKI
jgi:hypothetical protein